MRICNRVYAISQKVPESLRVFPHAQILLEYLDKTKFIPDTAPILRAYDCLLAASMNSEKRDFVHPAFMMILAQLSNDELVILQQLKSHTYKLVQSHKGPVAGKFVGIDELENEFPIGKLNNKNMYFMYSTHLNKLDLTNFPNIGNEAKMNEAGQQIASIQTYMFQLSEFGKLFSEVCLQ